MYFDDLVISLLVLTIFRFVAALIFMLQFFKYRKKKYCVTASGWLIYMAGPLPDLISHAGGVETLSRFFAYSAVVATFLLMLGILLYFREIKPIRLTIIIISTITILSLFVLFFPENTGILTILTQVIFLIGMLVFAVFNYRKVVSGRSSTSFFWFCATLFFGIVHAAGFYLFFKSAPYSIRFVFTFLINLSLLEFLIYLDLEQAQKAIHDSLKEKEILLQEVHHRVKNNLTIISSLLQLQSGKIEHEESIKLVKEIENRINAMALVHEQLYNSKNFNEIDFTSYIEDLIGSLRKSFENTDKPVNIKLDLIKTKFDLTKMIPMAMLINEIVTNAYKHAFVASENPEIVIRLYIDKNDEHVLSIRDNGSGLPEESRLMNSETTGFLIIDALVKQLCVKLYVKNEKGTEFLLVLPPSMAKKNKKSIK